MTLDQLLQVEANLEDSFDPILAVCGVPVFRTRDTDTATSPRLEMNVVLGNALDNHQHVFADGSWISNAWNGSMSVTVVTNRTETESRTKAHQRLLGLLRKALQQMRVISAWSANAPVFVASLVENGTEESFVDENDLDYSKVNWGFLCSLNPNAVNQSQQSALN
jgi:hypothetical protein